MSLFPHVTHFSVTLLLMNYRMNFNVTMVGFRSSKRSKGSMAGFDKVTKLTIIIFLSFLLFIIPYVSVTIIDSDQEMPLAHIITYLFAWVFYDMNPVIYTSLDQNFQAAYKHLLKKLPCIFIKEDDLQQEFSVIIKKNSSLERIALKENIERMSIVEKEKPKDTRVLFTNVMKFIRIKSSKKDEFKMVQEASTELPITSEVSFHDLLLVH